MVVDVVGASSMGFPHMVVGMDWPQTWVPVECVGVYGPWTQSTHQHRAMFLVCLDQMVEGEEKHVKMYKDNMIESKLSQNIGPYLWPCL
jgi:hypothetical protein